MATERIQIIVTSKGTVTVRKEIDQLGQSGERSARGVDMLKGALATVVSGATIAGLVRLSDAGTALQNSLRVAGLEGAEFNQVQDELFRIAKQNGQEVTTLAGIYQRLNTVQGQLGIGQEDIIEALENIGAGFKISSAGANAQAGALGQLQQLLGGTTVQMQEVNSLIDGAFPILQAVARGTDEFGGNVGALINRLREGGYSTKAFFDGLMRGSDINRQLAASFNLSIGQAIQNFRTSLIQTLIFINETTGAFSALANIINFAANNMGLLVVATTPLIAALTVLAINTIRGVLISAMISATTAIGSVISALGALALAALANPFTAVIAGVTALIAYFVILKTDLNEIIATFGKLTAIVGDLLGNEFLTRKGIEIVINADKAATELKAGAQKIMDSIKGGADAAAPTLKNAVAQGGAVAAGEIQRGMKNAAISSAALQADAQKRAIANYEALNGKAVKAIGAAHVEGGDYIYNAATGAVTKGAGEMNAAIAAGGDTAAQSMNEGIQSAGKAAGESLVLAGNTVSGQIAEALQRSALEVAAIIKGQMRAELHNIQAETMKLAAEARKLDAEAAAIRSGRDRRGGSGGGSGSGSGTGGGFSRGGGVARVVPLTDRQRAAMAGLAGLQQYEKNQAANQNQPATPAAPVMGEVQINNILDPAAMLAAVNTAEGRGVIVNLIKANREEFQEVLGVL